MTFWMNLSSADSFHKSRKGRLRRYHLFYAYHTPVPSTLSRTNKTAKGPAVYSLHPRKGGTGVCIYQRQWKASAYKTAFCRTHANTAATSTWDGRTLLKASSVHPPGV